MRAWLAAGLLLVGCTTARTIGQPNLMVRDETIDVTRRDQVDILFMIDDSLSMAPKQAALQASFPELVTRIQKLASAGAPASFHIGVVDSDLGAGSFAGCRPDGDGGRLRTAAAPSASGLPAACVGFTLPDGYIDVDSASGQTNLGSVDIATAFTCLASVGDWGCGFEHQLESVYRALTTPSLNPGFLRDDALLVVVFLTDEDDCSAPPDSPLFDPSQAGISSYGVLHSFRCTQFGVTCDGKALTGGPLDASRCAPAPGGLLFDVSRYTQLFGAGGVKQNASDVLLIAIDAPPTPFAVTVTEPCADMTNEASCPILQHSCVSGNPMLFGDPAVRLDAVLAATPSSLTASICDADYTASIDSLADAMAARMRAGCLPGATVDPANPACQVVIGGAEAPRCDSGRSPCWDVVEDPGCPARFTAAGAEQHSRLVIEGAAGGPVSASCPLYEPTP